jgi:hypothetical protein
MAQVRLNIADIVLALEFERETVAELVRRFWYGFLSDARPDAELAVSWRGEVELQWPNEWIQGDPVGKHRGPVYEAEWHFYRGAFDTELHTGELTSEGIAGLQHFLWALFSVVLPVRDGLLVHAASVGSRGNAFVFPASSGIGKSTLVRNSPTHIIFSDEGTILRCQQGQLFCYGSPFRSDNFRNLQWYRVPVHGIYFLTQAKRDSVVTISHAEAVERLLPQVFLYTDSPAVRISAYGIATNIIQLTETNQLELQDSPRFWRCITT